MTSNYMKRCSTSYPVVIREMQLKPKWGMATHLLEWLKWKQNNKLAIARADEEAEQLEASFIARGNGKWYSHSGKQSVSSNRELPVYSEVFTQEKWHVHRKMSTAASFITAPNWNPPGRPSTCGWINKDVRYILTIAYYSTIKEEWTMALGPPLGFC